MGYELHLAFRYLRSRKRSAFLSIITVISIGGVALGVTALCVVLSVMSGFEEDLKQKIVGTNAHAVILKYGLDFEEYDKVAHVAKQVEGVLGASPFILSEVMVASSTNTAGAVIKGIDARTTGTVCDLEKNVAEGGAGSLEELSAEMDDAAAAGEGGEEGGGGPVAEKQGEGAGRAEAALPGIVIGKELAHILRVDLGDRITVISPLSKDLGPMGPIPRSRQFRVVAIFYSGMYEYDTKFVYISLPQAQKFFSMGRTVTGVEMKVEDVYKAKQTAREAVRRLDGYPFHAKDWMQMNRNLFAALRLEKVAMFIILTFIVLVACFNIVSALIMMVLTKGKEIAILKSMGAPSSGIMKIFMLDGILIGAVGTALGLVGGVILCLAVEKYGIRLDPEIYYIHNLPVKMNPFEFLAVAAAAVVISFLSTFYPSLTASKLRPVEGLRYE